MIRCLTERTLVRIHTGDGTAAERRHLRLCADCAERYDDLVEDLETVDTILQQPPPRALPALARVPFGWRLPAAAMAAAALVLATAWWRMPAATDAGVHAGNVPQFAADVSAAVFAMADAGPAQPVADAPYLRAALDAETPCTTEEIVNGECADQLSALLLAGE